MKVSLPDDIVGGPTDTRPPELSAMEIYRGWLDEAPVCVILSRRPRGDRHIKDLLAILTPPFIEPSEAPIRVPGALSGRRVDGLYEMELGLSADWIEWVTVVVAATKRDFVVLTVRTRPGDELGALHEEIVASLEL